MILERMSKELGLPLKYLRNIAFTASYEYKEFTIPKRNGSPRVIHHPSKQLKSIQRWLLTNVFSNLPVHEAAMAYRPWVNTFMNATLHKNSHYLLRMDFLNFFPSFTYQDVTQYVEIYKDTYFKDWTTEDTMAVAYAVLRNGKLTIGAPTSPAVSNALCFELDSNLAAIAKKRGCVYTRYADDLFFLTTEPNVLKTVEREVPGACKSVQIPKKLRINKNKTRHSSRKRARQVTGVVLGSDGEVHVGRRYKRRIRAMIHKYDQLTYKEKAHLSGLIAYVIGFDRDFLNNLIEKYDLSRVDQARRHPSTFV